MESQSASHLQLTIAAAVVQSALLDHVVEDTAGPEETILAQLLQWKELTWFWAVTVVGSDHRLCGGPRICAYPRNFRDCGLQPTWVLELLTFEPEP